MRKSTHSTTEGASVESQDYSGLARTESDAPIQQNMSLRRCLNRQSEVAVQDDSSNSFGSPDIAVEAVSNLSPLQFQATTSDSDDGYVPPMESSDGRLDIYNSERTSPPDLLGNIVLPSLVSGVQTPLERRLLHYFIGTFSKILISTPSTDLNAINNVVLPMALQDEQDWGLLSLILSLSASHLSRALSRQTAVDDAEDLRQLEKTKWKHYSYALSRHARNLFWVIQQNNSAEVEQEPEVSQIDYAIAATMLLCQWSTCEGGDVANWRIHLDANRDLVRRKFTRRPNALSSALSDTSQVLLEWFYFHDILATVTSPERPCISISPEIMDAFGVSGAAEVLPKCFSNKPLLRSLWIGVNDGLLAIIERIIVLRQSTEAHSSTTDDGLASVQPTSQVNTNLPTASNPLAMRALKPNQLMEALTIEKALHDISLQYSTSQQSLVAQCYRLAASLMLHFTVYPTSPPNQGRAWDCLTQLLKLIEHISEEDSAVTCSLFPLFICGCFNIILLNGSIRDLSSWDLQAERFENMIPQMLGLLGTGRFREVTSGIPQHTHGLWIIFRRCDGTEVSSNSEDEDPCPWQTLKRLNSWADENVIDYGCFVVEHLLLEKSIFGLDEPIVALDRAAGFEVEEESTVQNVSRPTPRLTTYGVVYFAIDFCILPSHRGF
ncbi:C6 transcription factor [Fusarium subglutinans]|uniref:C6 transcription factor n=1 Tax=Gibberella subglutinans TaxID=42677 RepID=A0A8H5ULI6_GIBSU|nr:C6 transcription factor [Fusarium subglutinans]KAF5592652.1 C6 transcription factor [Fusarium subglutinans]